MNIINIRFESWYKLILDVNCLLLILFFAIIILCRSSILKKYFKHSLEIDEAELGIGNSKIKIKPNYTDYQISYKIWVELSTRKIGLPIDFENDVIDEIYDSWYEFFRITRELIKDIPVQNYQKYQSTQDIVRIAVEVLNEGLRPHLTKWQAKYRKWLVQQNGSSNDKTPQEIQRVYPQYDELVKDIENVNKSLMQYRMVMKEIILGQK